MEQHPVPQNIIDVEFKLFGSFTLKQFSKVIIGCLVGVVIYFFPIIPFIVKIPLIIIAVGAGILMALIPNFSVWLGGFLKSLFISPRYVWMKKENTPESLQTQKEKEVEKSQKVSSLTNKDKIDISEIPIEKLFSSKTEKEDYEELGTAYENDPVRKSNMERLYSQAFPGNVNQTAIAANQVSQQRLQQAPIVSPAITMENYQQRIEQLKYELSRLNKDSQYKAKEQQILSQIDQLYKHVKLLRKAPEPSYGDHPVQSTVSKGRNVTVSEVKVTTKTVFGIVVDKKDAPISRAGVIFSGVGGEDEYRAISSPDGRFATQELPVGKYDIRIEHPGYKFHTYQVDIKDQKLPAYKFRER